jgi:DAACS family dicarboxylate/amino acid:cation (Na+ or H+) symporter
MPENRSLGRWWTETPLYLRIVGALALGVVAGLLLGEHAAGLATPAKLILRLLGAIAPPMILFAIVRAFLHAQVGRGTAPKLAGLLLLNTTVAIVIGMAVANIIRPGDHAKLTPHESHSAAKAAADPLTQFLDNVPRSVLGPLTDDGKVLSVILLAIAFGLALRRSRDTPVRTVADLVDVGFNTMLTILHWVIQIIPFGVFGIVASIVGTKGFSDFKALGWFVVTVLVALALHTAFYLVRIRFWSWPRPWYVLRGMRDALVMAFSTASSTATMPVTYARLRDNVKLREKSASLGALVGANFNNDGTALYEAVSALFIAQMLGMELTLTQQLMVVLTSIAASVGAAGIPEAGLVTMTLVFKAVGLPVEYIAILLTVDWFLDRCRTTVNVMGDINVSCLLDGKTPGAVASVPSISTPKLNERAIPLGDNP